MYEGHLRKIAKFWYECMENILKIIEFAVATKTNDFEMYAEFVSSILHHE